MKTVVINPSFNLLKKALNDLNAKGDIGVAIQLDLLNALAKLEQIAFIIRRAENLAQASDGPCGSTRDCLTDDDIREIYKLATK